MFETVKTDVFCKVCLFDAKSLKTDFVMPLSSIWEEFSEASSLTYSFLVGPVAKTVDIFEINL